MTGIERKALELVNEVVSAPWNHIEEAYAFELRAALCRAIEKHEAFRQQVSDAAEATRLGTMLVHDFIDRFIVAKPDPLVEVIAELGMFPAGNDSADTFRAALAKRGLEIREKEHKPS